jgi:uncharacterized protein (DUF2252 family)
MTETDGVGTRITPATTIEERLAMGRAIRSEVPRTSLAAFGSSSGRDLIAILETQAASRVAQLNPIRYGRMSASPFAFFRGGAAIMAADLGSVVRSPIHVQLCGDAHLSNFGIFASPERRLVFDINDFDETIRGPFCWDLKRLAASIVIAGQDLGFTPKQQENAVLTMSESYRDGLNDFAGQRHLDVWYSNLAVNDLAKQIRRGVSSDQAAKVDGLISRAEAKDVFRAKRKLTEEVDGRRWFKSDPPILVRVADLTGEDPLDDEDAVERIVRTYHQSLTDDRRFLLSQYRVVDFARKVVGVGSVGTRCYIALLIGIDEDDPIILQVKEAQRSVLEPYLDPSPYDNQGRRVVEGQRMVQATPDIFLGWQRRTEEDGVARDFYVRQLHDQKGSVDIDNLDPVLMNAYAQVCGWALARAHARSGYRFVLSGYLGKGDVFPETMAAFAFSYAGQNEDDYRRYLDAIASGRLPAVTGI